jgi:predicted GNAT superfamily acetyltransferase
MPVPDYVIREPAGIEEYAQVAAVFQQVFSLPDRAVPPAWLMEDSTKAGGLTLGLWHGGQAVGFSYALAGLDGGGPYLYSSGLGVLPAHRSGGRAYALKVAQRALALDHGYRQMRWTYSALRSVNAHLYLTRLGGLASRYVIDTRGSFDSDWVTEGGVPLDEFAVDWDLESGRVRSRLDGAPGAPGAGLDAGPSISRCSGPASERVLNEIDAAPPAGAAVCEIPADFQFLVSRAPDLAHDWRAKTRPVFAQLMDTGFRLTECIRDAGRQRAYYVFEQAAGGRG